MLFMIQKKIRLLVSRDIVGEKVLYHYEDGNLIVISSQLGPILEIVRDIKINTDVLKNIFLQDIY